MRKGRKRENVRFARKNSPEMLRASHLTTTIFWPLSSCFATVLARRPRRCPLPSMTTYKFIQHKSATAFCQSVLCPVAKISRPSSHRGGGGTHHWIGRGHPAQSPVQKENIQRKEEHCSRILPGDVCCRRLLSLWAGSTHTTESDVVRRLAVAKRGRRYFCAGDRSRVLALTTNPATGHVKFQPLQDQVCAPALSSTQLSGEPAHILIRQDLIA